MDHGEKSKMATHCRLWQLTQPTYAIEFLRYQQNKYSLSSSKKSQIGVQFLAKGKKGEIYVYNCIFIIYRLEFNYSSIV